VNDPVRELGKPDRSKLTLDRVYVIGAAEAGDERHNTVIAAKIKA
jgi:hypothetical protein